MSPCFLIFPYSFLRVCHLAMARGSSFSARSKSEMAPVTKQRWWRSDVLCPEKVLFLLFIYVDGGSVGQIVNLNWNWFISVVYLILFSHFSFKIVEHSFRITTTAQGGNILRWTFTAPLKLTAGHPNKNHGIQARNLLLQGSIFRCQMLVFLNNSLKDIGLSDMRQGFQKREGSCFLKTKYNMKLPVGPKKAGLEQPNK